MRLSNNQQQLLDELINRFERKQGYGLGEPSKRGTIIDVKKFFSKYSHTSNSIYKNEINAELQELEKNNFIQLVWEKYNVGEYLEKVYLNEEELTGIYELLSRVPKKEKYEQAKQFVLEYRKDVVPSLMPIMDATLEKLEKLENLTSIVDVENIQLTKDYFYGLNELLKSREREISKRHWSIQLYNDSKRWEVLEQKIINVLKKEIYPEYDGLEKGTILGIFGIIENPKSIDIFGKCTMSKDGKEIDFSIDENGVGMYPSFFRKSEIMSLEVDRIVTIENKTSYHDYLVHSQSNKKNELILYLGGYHNHIRTVILQKLHNFIQENELEIPFFHWGDIDFGGLSILVNLRSKTGIPFQPLYMDIETYKANLVNGREIEDKQYIKKIEKLLNDDKFKEFERLIKSILNNKVRIEQESIIL